MVALWVYSDLLVGTSPRRAKGQVGQAEKWGIRSGMIWIHFLFEHMPDSFSKYPITPPANPCRQLTGDYRASWAEA